MNYSDNLKATVREGRILFVLILMQELENLCIMVFIIITMGLITVTCLYKRHTLSMILASGKTKKIELRSYTLGEHLIILCISTGLRLFNGSVFNDHDGKITCFQPGEDKTVGYSVVYYGIVSEKIMSENLLFGVNPLNLISDHCLLEFSI